FGAGSNAKGNRIRQTQQQGRLTLLYILTLLYDKILHQWQGCQHTKVGPPAHSDPEHLAHVERLRVRATRERPVEVVQEARERELHRRGREQGSWTLPPPSSKRDELKVRRPPVVAVGAVRRATLALDLEPLRPELISLVPVPRVPGDGERVCDHGDALGHVVSHDLAVFLARAKDQRRGRMQPQGLLDDHPEVAEAAEVCAGDASSSLFSRISCVALDIAGGFLMSSAMAHSSVVAVVSVADPNMS
ncbi:hypothetical protein U9M48_007718, partial [Paspalum notatum var. saurae]